MFERKGHQQQWINELSEVSCVCVLLRTILTIRDNRATSVLRGVGDNTNDSENKISALVKKALQAGRVDTNGLP